jgi:hypothetical protein
MSISLPLSDTYMTSLFMKDKKIEVESEKLYKSIDPFIDELNRILLQFYGNIKFKHWCHTYYIPKIYVKKQNLNSYIYYRKQNPEFSRDITFWVIKNSKKLFIHENKIFSLYNFTLGNVSGFTPFCFSRKIDFTIKSNDDGTYSIYNNSSKKELSFEELMAEIYSYFRYI